ncbi:MAG: hypothetical protein R2856_06055 [Caldilineaceae bacterium]
MGGVGRRTLAVAALVARADEDVLGWVAPESGVGPSCSCGGGGREHLHRSVRGQGIGRALLNAIIIASEAADIWTLQSASSRNQVSVRLHEALWFPRGGPP